MSSARYGRRRRGLVAGVRRWARHTPNARIAFNLIAAGAVLAIATVVLGLMVL